MKPPTRKPPQFKLYFEDLEFKVRLAIPSLLSDIKTIGHYVRIRLFNVLVLITAHNPRKRFLNLITLSRKGGFSWNGKIDWKYAVIALLIGLLFARTSNALPAEKPLYIKPIKTYKPLKQVKKHYLHKKHFIALPKPRRAVVAHVSSSGCGDNSYAHFIYMHESGCDPSAVNSIGCRGIGQACPGSKLPCGADYVCQNRYFTAYALSTYGSWEAAYNAWISKNWW